MTELMKKRNELNSQRMNGLNDPVKPSTTRNAPNDNSWTTMRAEVPTSFTSQPSQMTEHPLSQKFSPRASEKEIPIKSLLQQSCLHQRQKEASTKRRDEQIPSWNIPTMSYEAMQPFNFKSNKDFGKDEILPHGAYYETPMYVDELGNPVTFQSQQTPTALTRQPEQPTTISNAPMDFPQTSRCTDANCLNC